MAVLLWVGLVWNVCGQPRKPLGPWEGKREGGRTAYRRLHMSGPAQREGRPDHRILLGDGSGDMASREARAYDTPAILFAIRRVFVYFGAMKAKSAPAKNGRRGGRARSAVKSLAARQNILLRWHPPSPDGVIPPEALIDGAWYFGEGRSASIALWDGSTKTFHTVATSSWIDPTTYPLSSRRMVRLKQERHVAARGTFSPRSILAKATR